MNKKGLNKQYKIRVSSRNKCRILRKCNSRTGFPEDRLLGHVEKRFLKRYNHLFAQFKCTISLRLPSSFLIYILCTGGAYYVTYRFRFISNKSWDGGGRGGGLSLNRPIVRRGEFTRGWVILLNSPVWWIK
jgi:hypothetical protein